MDPLEQLQSWIAKEQIHDPQKVSEQLNEWLRLIHNAQENVQSLSSQNAALLSELCMQHEGLIKLLQKIKDSETQNPIDQLTQLRHELHKINVEFLLKTAEFPEQFLPLIFTQSTPSQAFGANQLDALRESLKQFNTPALKTLTTLIQSILDWSESSQKMLNQLNAVSDQAADFWLEQVDPNQGPEQRLALWAKIYDQKFQEAYDQPEMQTLQGELINRLSQAKLNWQQLLEQMSEPLGLPTRNQIDQLVGTLDQQRRRIRKLELEIAELRVLANKSDH